LKIAEKERLRKEKEKARGALQTTAGPSAEEIEEKDRIAKAHADALLEEIDNEQKVGHICMCFMSLCMGFCIFYSAI
jgi:hypothetical protein